MENLKKFLIALYSVWSAISLVVLVGVLVINYGFDKPKTYGFQYFDDIKPNTDIVSDSVEEDNHFPIFELNICQSETNPDLRLYEMAVTYYTDYEQNDYKRFVMQVVGKYSYFTPKDNLIWGTSESSLVNSQVSYYEVDSNETWREITDLSIFEESLDEVIVTAGGQNYILQLGGPKGQYAYRYVRYSTNGWNRWNRWFNITTEDTAYTDYNSADLFNYLMTSFYGNKNFEGNKLFKNLDLDRFFTITKSNDKGQYYQISDFTDNNAYFKVKFANKLITSHLTAKDSLIGVVNGDINFSTGVENESTPFYSTSVDFKFSNEAFTQKYNEKLTKYVLTLKQGYKDYLLSLNNLSLSINIDLDSLNLPYLSYGLDLNSFVGLDIKSIKIQKLVGPEINFYLIGSCKAEIQASEFIHLLNELGGVWHE